MNNENRNGGRREVEPKSDGQEDAKRASDVTALLARACLPPGAGETKRKLEKQPHERSGTSSDVGDSQGYRVCRIVGMKKAGDGPE